MVMAMKDQVTGTDREMSGSWAGGLVADRQRTTDRPTSFTTTAAGNIANEQASVGVEEEPPRAAYQPMSTPRRRAGRISGLPERVPFTAKGQPGVCNNGGTHINRSA
jgi:hypothetical protein